MPHLWYLCFMYGDLLWPDLDLEPSLISSIYSISILPYILGVLEVSFGPKLIILRSLRLVTWKSRFWLLTWPWPDTWPHLENFRGCFRIVSSRAFERRIGRLSAAVRSRVMTWGRLTPLPSKSRVAKYPRKCRVNNGVSAVLHKTMFNIITIIIIKPLSKTKKFFIISTLKAKTKQPRYQPIHGKQNAYRFSPRQQSAPPSKILLKVIGQGQGHIKISKTRVPSKIFIYQPIHENFVFRESVDNTVHAI